MSEPEDAAGLRALAQNRQMPDANRLTVTLGELRAALASGAEWRDHIPSGAGYEEVSCSCGWDSGGKLGWGAHIDAAERIGRA